MVKDVRWILRLVWWSEWSNYQDVCVWYDQPLTVVKQKCEEFVKVAIQWNRRDMFKKKKGIYFQFSVSCIVFLCTFLVFLFHHFLTTNHKKKRRWWWTNASDGDVSYLTTDPIKGEFCKHNWKWWKMWDVFYDLYGEVIQLRRYVGV